MTTRIKGIEQGRAKTAYDFVRQVVDGKLEDKDIKDIKFGKAVFAKKEWDYFLSKFDQNETIGTIENEQTGEAEKIEVSIDTDKISEDDRKGLGKEAFSEILQHTSKLKSIKKEYKTGVKKIPVFVKTNGLGQTLAFIKNRNDGYNLIYRQLSIRLQEEFISGGDELVEKIIQLSSSRYRQVTTEVLAFSNWLKRFVDGLMKDVEEET